MCTVTIVRLGETLRLACNRDELRTRPAALPPEMRSFGSRHAILPIDQLSNGTWIAVNDAGLAATLLNVNPRSRPHAPATGNRRSRGELIPALLAQATIEDALAAVTAINPREYPPFRIVVLDSKTIVEIVSDGTAINEMQTAIGVRPLFFTSSGLGDHFVEGPRRALFEQMFAPGADLAAQQSAFHRHSWPERRHLSVCMERADACTVSYTVIDMASQRCELSYYAGAPDQSDAVLDHSLSLPRTIA